MLKNSFIFIVLAIYIFSFASATELKLVKVSDLKVGDVIVADDGSEVVVESLKKLERGKTLGELLNEKIYGNRTLELKEPMPKIIGVGNVVYSTKEESYKEGIFTKIAKKIKEIFGK